MGAIGDAGTEVPLQVHREGRTIDVVVESVDRRTLLKGPIMH